MTFDGYKTYIFGVLLGISALLYAFGWIDAKAFTALVAIFGGSGSMIGFRSAMNKK